MTDFIELTFDETKEKTLLNVSQILQVKDSIDLDDWDSPHCTTCIICIGESEYTEYSEDYDTVKQLIKGASTIGERTADGQQEGGV